MKQISQTLSNRTLRYWEASQLWRSRNRAKRATNLEELFKIMRQAEPPQFSNQSGTAFVPGVSDAATPLRLHTAFDELQRLVIRYDSYSAYMKSGAAPYANLKSSQSN